MNPLVPLGLGGAALAFFASTVLRPAPAVMFDISSAAPILVRSFDGKTTVDLKAAAASQRVVLTLLRRFGCLLCREGAADLSKIKPQLDAAGVRMIAVAHEKLGYEDFAKGNYWAGELYFDEEKDLYKALGTQRSGWLGMLRPDVWQSIFRAKGKEFDGNVDGDGWQLGGTFVLGPEGVIFAHRQAHFGDHPDPQAVLAAALTGKAPSSSGSAAAGKAAPADKDCGCDKK
eukprot:tig00021517_g22003.t1